MRVQHALLRATFGVFLGRAYYSEQMVERITNESQDVEVYHGETVEDMVEGIDKAETVAEAMSWIYENVTEDAGYIDDIKTAALLIIAGEDV